MPVYDEALRKTVERGALVLEYQPVIALMDGGSGPAGSILLVDTVVRWRHRTLGLVPAAAVFERAARLGMVSRISAWMISRALGQFRRLQTRGWTVDQPAVGLLVSLQAAALDEALPAHVTEALQESRMPANALVIGFPVSVASSDTVPALARLRTLALSNVRLAVDDFGAGQLDVPTLSRLEIAYARLERNSLPQHAHQFRDSVIAQSLVQLAHGLGMRVIAKGVQSSAEANALAALGCDLAQGTFFSKPLGPLGVASLLRNPDTGNRR